MDRRRFLGGVFGGVAASGLIIKATGDDIAQFANGLEVGAPMMSGAVDTQGGPPCAYPGELLFNHKGQPVAVVESIRIDVEPIGYAGNSGFTEYVPGLRTIRITAVTSGPSNARFHRTYFSGGHNA